MLEQWLWPHLEEDFLSQLYFQQDGAPPRFQMTVRDFLDENLPGAWIGLAGPTSWTHTFRHLPRETYTYGDLRKISITTTDPQSVRELGERISLAIAKADESQSQRTWEEFEIRLDMCRVSNDEAISPL
jgi:hypothetical protein